MRGVERHNTWQSSSHCEFRNTISLNPDKWYQSIEKSPIIADMADSHTESTPLYPPPSYSLSNKPNLTSQLFCNLRMSPQMLHLEGILIFCSVKGAFPSWREGHQKYCVVITLFYTNVYGLVCSQNMRAHRLIWTYAHMCTVTNICPQAPTKTVSVCLSVCEKWIRGLVAVFTEHKLTTTNCYIHTTCTASETDPAQQGGLPDMAHV